MRDSTDTSGGRRETATGGGESGKGVGGSETRSAPHPPRTTDLEPVETGSAAGLQSIGRVMYVVGTAFLLLYLLASQSVDALGGDPAGGLLVAVVVAVLGAAAYVTATGWRLVSGVLE